MLEAGELFNHQVQYVEGIRAWKYQCFIHEFREHENIWKQCKNVPNIPQEKRWHLLRHLYLPANSNSTSASIGICQCRNMSQCQAMSDKMYKALWQDGCSWHLHPHHPFKAMAKHSILMTSGQRFADNQNHMPKFQPARRSPASSLEARRRCGRWLSGRSELQGETRANLIPKHPMHLACI